MSIGCLQRIAAALERIADEMYEMNPKVAKERAKQEAADAKYEKQKSCDAKISKMFSPFLRMEGNPKKRDEKLKSATDSVLWFLVYSKKQSTDIDTFDPETFDWESAVNKMDITDLKRSRFLIVLNRWRAAQKI